MDICGVLSSAQLVWGLTYRSFLIEGMSSLGQRAATTVDRVSWTMSRKGIGGLVLRGAHGENRISVRLLPFLSS